MRLISECERYNTQARKSWDLSKKSAAVIMIYPCTNSAFQSDLSTMLVQNELDQNGYGSVDLLNLYSKLNADLSKEVSEINTSDNDKQILESVQSVDNVVLCHGKAGEGNKKVAVRQNAVLKLLLPYKEKVLTTQDGRGVKCLHPLTPTLRGSNGWMLAPFDFPTFEEEALDKENSETKKKGSKKSNKQAQAQSEAKDKKKAEREDKIETA